MKLFPFSSHKDISRPSPHNILYCGKWVGVVRCVPLSRGVLLRGNCVSHPPNDVFPSPLPEYLQSLVRFSDYGLPVVSVWDRAGFNSGNGIIPITACAFYLIGSRPTGLHCIKPYVMQVHKKATCPFIFSWGGREYTHCKPLLFSPFSGNP